MHRAHRSPTTGAAASETLTLDWTNSHRALVSAVPALGGNRQPPEPPVRLLHRPRQHRLSDGTSSCFSSSTGSQPRRSRLPHRRPASGQRPAAASQPRATEGEVDTCRRLMSRRPVVRASRSEEIHRPCLCSEPALSVHFPVVGTAPAASAPRGLSKLCRGGTAFRIRRAVPFPQGRAVWQASSPAGRV